MAFNVVALGLNEPAPPLQIELVAPPPREPASVTVLVRAPLASVLYDTAFTAVSAKA